MKKLLFPALILLIVMPLCQAQFTANFTIAEQGNKKIYKVQSDGTKYRYDFEDSGMKGIVIVNPETEKTAILMPDKKFVHYTELSSGISKANDPFQSFLSMRLRYTEKKMGSEKINGYVCEKSELYAGDQKLFTAWYSEKLNFLLKMINDRKPDSYVELADIKPGKIDSSVFKVPEEYTEVDQRMRPLIPEPPPPDSWNKIEATLPIMGEFKRGDQITFKIIEDKHHKILLRNPTADPAKIIRRSVRDGKELPDNEQGPLKWRTDRLFANETSSNSYVWKPGDIIIIEVHEGKMEIEIIVEK